MKESATESAGEPIGNHPALESCIRKRKTCAEQLTESGGRALWLPVWLGDHASTCFEIIDPAPCCESTLHVMEGVLAVYRNYQSILDYSERDSLTGLLNRKTFDEKFSKLLAANSPETVPSVQQERRHQAAEKGQWLAVVDIDHFKRVNDQFGHLYGDEVLILVANVLRASFRAQDRIFRFGGEEFVVLLRSASLGEAHRIFERFRRNIEQHDFPQVGRVTVSVGFASISKESPVVILGHADQALYYAKANGRNRVCHYEELVKSGLLHSGITNESAEFFF
jgi:diguanylate cyclase (GGDEF)-like protein